MVRARAYDREYRKESRTFDHEIRLIGIVDGQDEFGFPINEERPKDPILANKISVRSSDYWQAKQAGVELTVAFEIHAFEYAGEELFLYDGREHRIERTYEKGDLLEIYGTRKADEHL